MSENLIIVFGSSILLLLTALYIISLHYGDTKPRGYFHNHNAREVFNEYKKIKGENK